MQLYIFILRNFILVLLLLLAISPSYATSTQSHINQFELTDETLNTNLFKQGRLYLGEVNDAFPNGNLSSWLQNKQPISQLPVFGGNVWFVLEIDNQTTHKQFQLYPYNSVIDHIETRIYHQSDSIAHLTQPTSITLTGAKHPSLYPFHFGNNLTLMSGEKQLLITRLNSEYFYTPPKLVLKQPHALKRQAMIENVIMMLCFGFGISLGIYNLLIYMGSKDATHLFYALFTASWVFAWSHFFHIPKELFNVSCAGLHWLGFLLLPITNSLFYIHLLKLKETRPHLAKASIWVGIISAAGIPITLYYPGFGFLWASLTTGVAMFLGLYIGISSWVSGFKPARYFVLAYIGMLLPNMFANATNFGLLPAVDVNLYLLGLMGTTLDALLLAFAVADKLRIINNENIELNQNLESKVKERTQELEVLTHELMDANHAKSRFLANMSHEIRTPMTSIIGYAEGIVHGDISKDKHMHAVNVISQNGKHVLGLINDILDMSKIEADKLKIEHIDTDLFASIAEVGSLLGRQIRDKGLLFNIDYQFPIPSHIISDPTRLRQILLNLTNNAIKFTQQGFVNLKVTVTQNKLRIHIIDSGIGMSQKQVDNLFSEYNQADASTTRKFGGTGLGLHISKSLAERMGGDIFVNSILTEGTEFIVELPCILTDDSQWLHSFEQVNDQRTKHNHSLTDAPTSLAGHVLLAEDHPDNRLLITKILERMGLKVTAVENGQHAVQAVLDDEFDLILLDIQMPVMDGLEAINIITSTGCTAPIVALTANAMKEEKEDYINNGFIDHIAKPIDRNEFNHKVSHYLNIEEQDINIPESEMAELTAQFIQSLPTYQQQTERYFELNDLDELAKIAHAIRGAAAMFGYEELSQLAHRLELAAKQKHDVEFAMTMIQEEFSSVLSISH